MTAQSVQPRTTRTARQRGVVGVAIVALLAAVLLLWAKWMPYASKVGGLATSRHWAGGSILHSSGIKAGEAPSWHAAWSFAVVYGLAVWKAFVAALLIAAALQSLIPRGWLAGLLTRRRPMTSALAGGAVSMPSMMCTCCTAPVAVSLRRCGAPTSAVLAYWMGNPLLNPAVLVFLALVAPWQWVVTRVVVGVLLVVGGSAFIASFARREQVTPAALPPADEFSLSAAPRRFVRALLRLALVLVPEYLVVVLLVGAFAGWLLPLAHGSGNQPLATLAAVVLGTLVVIPTGGEIPLAQGLTSAGVGLGVIGALLITLPAVSLPSLVMVGRALTWRVTVAAAAVVALAGTAAAALLAVLT